MSDIQLHHGDCLDVLRTLPDASVDAVVTDPPYGLEFMGKEWDGADGFRRSLNPNDVGRDNAFGRTSRTSPEYRTSAAVAGMSKPGIGKRETDWPSHMGGLNPKCRNCSKWQRGANPCACEAPDFPNERLPRLHSFQEWCEAWATECLRVLKPGGHLLAFGGTRTWHRLACAVEDAGFEIRDSIAWMYGSGFPKSLDVSKAIDKARKDDPAWRIVGQWVKGYREAAGYATRSEFAPLILEGHKNLESAAANLSNWENGLSFPTWERWLSLKALLSLPDDMDGEVWRLNGRKGKPGDNFEAREVIGERAGSIGRGNWRAMEGRLDQMPDRFNVTAPATPDAERWQGWGTALKPAFEPVVVARKPLSGTVAATVLQHGTGALNIDASRVGDRWPANVVLDQVVALDLLEAPYFYTPKADSDERVRVNGTAHPTVKPLALMRWLVRLVTPPGGTVLEPFAGSGTTVEACLLEGFDCIAIEREAEYLPLIRQRIARRRDPVEAVRGAGEDGGLFDLLNEEPA